MQRPAIAGCRLLFWVCFVSFFVGFGALPASSPKPLVSAPIVNSSVVFQAGENGYFCFRVPSVASVGARVLVFAEARRPSCDDQAPKDIVYKVSIDNGLTWSALSRLVGTQTGNFTYRNPYATVFRSSDSACPAKLLVGFVNSTLPEPWINYHLWSCDAGQTWSDVEPINLAPWEGVLAGPGSGVQLDNSSASYAGRIIGCGATGYHVGHSMNAVVWFSDDGGQSYQVSATSFPQMQECQIVQLFNGSLLMNMRNSHLNGCDCRANTISTDGGESWQPITWAPQLIEPVCSAGLFRLGNALYFSNPHSTSQRVNMTIQVATSDDLNWQIYQQVWTGPSAYSVLGQTPNNNLLLVYERGTMSPYEELATAIITPFAF
eukprot:m.43294 g.43294  ORF g.43294 m.43294 type:complete len:376 (-) comp12018_c0_seq1:40-1167(-)